VHLSSTCGRAGGLTSLKSFTLTFNPNVLSDSWINGANELLTRSPLELFQAYATETVLDSPMTGLLVSRLILSHGPRLTKFSVHRIRLRIHTIEEVCNNCTNLRQLFVMLHPSDLVCSFNPLSHVCYASSHRRRWDPSLLVLNTYTPYISTYPNSPNLTIPMHSRSPWYSNAALRSSSSASTHAFGRYAVSFQ
jgi:hypothetical protein